MWFGYYHPFPSPVSKFSIFLNLPVSRRSSLLRGGRGGGRGEPNHTTARKPCPLKFIYYSLIYEAIAEQLQNYLHVFSGRKSYTVAVMGGNCFPSLGGKKKCDENPRHLARRRVSRGGQNDDFRPLTYSLGGRGKGCRDKYVTSWDPS